MNILKLLSHAIPPSPHNTQSITFYGGKPQTMVLAECVAVRERVEGELVHLRADDNSPYCVACGQITGATRPWYSDRDRWEDHAARCAQRSV